MINIQNTLSHFFKRGYLDNCLTFNGVLNFNKAIYISDDKLNQPLFGNRNFTV